MFGPLFPHLDKGRITFFLTADISLGVVTLKKKQCCLYCCSAIFWAFFYKACTSLFFTYFWLPWPHMLNNKNDFKCIHFLWTFLFIKKVVSFCHWKSSQKRFWFAIPCLIFGCSLYNFSRVALMLHVVVKMPFFMELKEERGGVQLAFKLA